ncbi:acyl-CoA thioesterase [Acinetobacter bereziniae]|uniref:Acyl-CoA thioesterase n=1 Tax=Acinetobacter bereziniae TaxID=106648 RepID=A0A8I1DHD3_ACIBZ|nr:MULTISPECIES: thioesterase family protein [Acinetobacter]MEC8123592.1 thioesterase family protein [Pseudomonadota bacterium]MBJ9951226.1 acyl-CoA thioesterase [Acinetobacter bereziniae]MCU4476431.1 acyl-CoA thioesterase [Acinetobacter bereziniae]MCU4543546.1 acyl-CoA thioesterase [Acinetobacter bereziniae]MCU4627869.1 acyl-CoA thioesterase [Acinetobacter bereziniae]
MKPQIKLRDQYAFIFPIQTRWADNDIYGHVNNVTYYSYFDTAANALLIQKADFDIHQSPIIGLVVNSSCDFFQELTYPEIIEVGVAISKIGNASLTYDLAIFKQGQPQASAQGQFVHVFVSRKTKKSTPIPQDMRDALQIYLSE